MRIVVPLLAAVCFVAAAEASATGVAAPSRRQRPRQRSPAPWRIGMQWGEKGAYPPALAHLCPATSIYRPTACLNSRSSVGNASVQTRSSPGSGRT